MMLEVSPELYERLRVLCLDMMLSHDNFEKAIDELVHDYYVRWVEDCEEE